MLPGDRVDILLTRELGDDQKDLVTDIILQGIVVIGIDQLTDEQRDKPQVARTATVEVTSRGSAEAGTGNRGRLAEPGPAPSRVIRDGENPAGARQ